MGKKNIEKNQKQRGGACRRKVVEKGFGEMRIRQKSEQSFGAQKNGSHPLWKTGGESYRPKVHRGTKKDSAGKPGVNSVKEKNAVG